MMEPVPDAVAVELVVKATLLLAAASIAVRLLRRSSAALRRHVWVLALVSLVALPALTAVLPAWRVGGVSPADTRMADSAVSSPGPDGQVASRPASQGHDAAVSGAGEAGPQGRRWGWLTWLWLLGAALVGAWLVAGVVGAHRARSRCQVIDDERWRNLRERAGNRARVGRTVPVAFHDGMGTPACLGIVRPLVTLPRHADAWPTGRLEDVLVHELAHVRRADNLFHLVGRVACMLFWFHPLVWFAVYRLRVEREHAADDAALDSGANAADYAEHLLAIARSARGSWLRAEVALMGGVSLEARVSAVLDRRRNHRPISGRAAWAMGLLAAMFASPLACTTTEPRPSAPVQESGLVDRTPLAIFDADGATIDLLAVDVPASVERRAAFPMTIFWRVRTPFPEDPPPEDRWRVFVHFDGPLPSAPSTGDQPAMRFQADHSVNAPGEWWLTREVVEDRFAVMAGHGEYAAGRYAVYIGWFKGRPGEWTNADITRSAPGHDDPHRGGRFRVGEIALR